MVQALGSGAKVLGLMDYDRLANTTKRKRKEFFLAGTKLIRVLVPVPQDQSLLGIFYG